MRNFPAEQLTHTKCLSGTRLHTLRGGNQTYMSVSVSCNEQRDPSELSLETAMGVYDLKESELLWEKALDTKLLMAWNDHMMVLAFRGTASVSNALADLQVCPAAPREICMSLGNHTCVLWAKGGSQVLGGHTAK